jgi:hypothetical protein
VRAATEDGGANSEACTSQCCAVAGTASSTLPGHVGTDSGVVEASVIGGMMPEKPFP